MSVLDLITVVLLLLSAGFFAGGTLGLLRFPDVLTRLHALTKADNLGLGLLVLALVVQADSVAAALKLVLIWVLAMVIGAGASYLVGRQAIHRAGSE